MEVITKISTFHEYAAEAIFAIGQGLDIICRNNPEEKFCDYLTNRDISCEINYRYAFLMISNSLEAAANAMILAVLIHDDVYKNIEKKDLLHKIDFFCKRKEVSFDKGSHKAALISEIIDCRNEFVHPKPKHSIAMLNKQSGVIEYDIKRTGTRKYPLYFSEMQLRDTLNALKDSLDFISWIVFDLCKYPLKDGALLIGYNSFGHIGTLLEINNSFKLDLDLRCFGLT